MQDGAPCHTARSITTWLKDSKVQVLDWVSQSCDLNPIENLWRELKQIIARMEGATNLNDLSRLEDSRPEEGVPRRPHLLHAQPRAGRRGRRGGRHQVLRWTQICQD